MLVLLFGCRKTTGPDNSAPYKPHDPEPLDGSVEQPVNGELRWSGGDPDGDPVFYDVYFGTDPIPALATSAVLPEYDPGILDTFTTYYWKIISRDNHDVEVQGNVWHFTTGNNPPFVPSSPFPSNGSVNQSPYSILEWTGGDPDGDTVTYYVYFGKTSPPHYVANNQSEENYDPRMLSYNTTYYWKIVARDRHNNTTQSPIWEFATWDTLPIPSNIQISADTEGDGIVLSWDQMSNIDGYEIIVPDGDTFLLNDDEIVYHDDIPGLTGTYFVSTYRGEERSKPAQISTRPCMATFGIHLYVWSHATEPAGFGLKTATGAGSVYDCNEMNKDSVDFYLNDSTAVFDFTSGDQSPYEGNKSTGIFIMGPNNFFEAPAIGYINSSLVVEANYYAIKVQGDYYAKLFVVNVVSGTRATFHYDFQKIAGLRIF
jgi:hypothetical protein